MNKSVQLPVRLSCQIVPKLLQSNQIDVIEKKCYEYIDFSKLPSLLLALYRRSWCIFTGIFNTFARLFSFCCLIYSGNLFNHFSSITHSPQSQNESCESIVLLFGPLLNERNECFIVSVVGLMPSVITGVRLLWTVDCKNKLNQWKRDHQLWIKRWTIEFLVLYSIFENWICFMGRGKGRGMG